MKQADLDEMVAVRAIGGGRPGRSLFEGEPALGPYGRIFGGQLIGQAVSAATTQVDDARPGRDVHSLHASFLRAGDTHARIEYEVTVLRDGRSFSVRSVTARQNERALLTATISFTVPAEGPTFEQAAAAGYPVPESLSAGHGEFAAPGATDGDDLVEHTRPGHRSAVEIRRVPAAADPRGGEVRSGQAIWLRAAAPRSGTTAADRAVLALATDFTALEVIVKGHGLTFASEGLSATSLDHSIWWHAPTDLTDWVLYVQESPWSGGERGLVLGRVYDRNGRLLASVAQEGLVRQRPGTAHAAAPGTDADDPAPPGSPS